MKKISSLLFILFATSAALAQHNKMELGDLKLNQPIQQKAAIQSFYKETLAVQLVSFEEPVVRDYIQFENGFRINLIYTDENEALTPEHFEKGLWIKILVSDFDESAERIRNSTASIIKEKDGSELYFQAPGGQIFRMVKAE